MKSNELILFERILAVRLFHEKGFEEAIRVFAEHRKFIEANIDRPYLDVRDELADKLQKIRKTIVLDQPELFNISIMENEALAFDQARDILAAAKAMADHRGISYSRLRFYIGCFDGKYGYLIIKGKKKV